MALTKVFTALALSALGGAASAWAPAICNAVDPAPDGLVCGQTGFASNPAGKLFSIERLSRESCTTYCGSNEACTTFEYRNTAEGSCTLFGGAFSDLRFNADDHAWDEYYEMGCFQCSKNALIDLTFNTMQSADDWSMTQDVEDSFFFDNVKIGAENVFRILDAEDSGSAVLTYAPTFQLEAGPTYKLAFGLKTNFPDDTDWSLLTFFLATNDELVVEYNPRDGAQTGDWINFSTEFTVRPVDAGEGSLLIKADASGKPLDWYFSYIYLQSL
ncbi:hypothetical protein BKA56DRAFT_702667 [Ilyonectria sp. MPI-CAGE-AT-0026]|nr:hypothetical protein BKA56DRAFT_702667 [Ilyonectria sp. MPI-CAGE-AT-0026]